MPRTDDVLLRAVALGVVAGMRSQLPLAMLCLAAHQQGRGEQSVSDRLTSPGVTALLLASTAGELVIDKLPFTPSRLRPGSLVLRAGLGSLAGALLMNDGGLRPLSGWVLGACGALAGSYAGHDVRAGLVAATRLPDPVIAILEDVTAVAIGSYAVGLAGRPDRASATR